MTWPSLGSPSGALWRGRQSDGESPTRLRPINAAEGGDFMKRSLVFNGLALGAIALVAGCAGSTSRTAVVATQFQAPPASPASWVESANISYVQPAAKDAVASPTSTVVPA